MADGWACGDCFRLCLAHPHGDDPATCGCALIWSPATLTPARHAVPRLPEKRPDLSFDTVLGNSPVPAWADDRDQVGGKGNALTEKTVFVHRPSGTVLFTDLLQRFPNRWFGDWRAVVARLDLMTGPRPSVPRTIRAAFRNKPAPGAVRRILDWLARQVVMAHGVPVVVDALAFLRRAFRFLLC